MTGVTRTSVGRELSNVDVQPPQDAVRSIRVKKIFFPPELFLNLWHEGLIAVRWADLKTVSQSHQRFLNHISETSVRLLLVSCLLRPLMASCLREGGGGSHDGASCPNAVRVTLIMDAWRTLPSCIMGKRAAVWPFCLSVQCGKSRISWSQRAVRTLVKLRPLDMWRWRKAATNLFTQSKVEAGDERSPDHKSNLRFQPLKTQVCNCVLFNERENAIRMNKVSKDQSWPQ